MVTVVWKNKIMGRTLYDDLDKTKTGTPEQFYKLQFSQFQHNGDLIKWELDVHFDTFKKIIGTTEPKWITLKKNQAGKYVE